ncbi:MAG: hypothetical protein CMK33_05555 [Porticoccaceae bacterium]|nr:hypothetical protein [Porticoccaceae bacterium]
MTHTVVGLLRGINVGGRHRLPMAQLRALLEGLGLRQVRTYIQSGNLVFVTPAAPDAALADAISRAIESAHGFAPHVLLVDEARWRTMVATHPAPDADGKTVHAFFLDAVPSAPDHARLEALRADSETLTLGESVVWLHAPEGIGRSKLAAGLEQALGVTTTARNAHTVQALTALIDAGD